MAKPRSHKYTRECIILVENYCGVCCVDKLVGRGWDDEKVDGYYPCTVCNTCVCDDCVRRVRSSCPDCRDEV